MDLGATLIGTTISHYRIIGHVGAGGMGTVYLAEDVNLRRKAALKFLSPDAARSAEAAARLLREARAASALDHPNIATIYEIGEFGTHSFIAMAYYEGETLAERLSRGALSIKEVARIVAQVADALAAAHAAGIVHRDLKPSNLILTPSGQVKVLDFGIAKVETSDETTTQLTRAGTTVGTVYYMSPEQAAGEPVDARSDLWSLGVVTYEMITGRRPFDGANSLAILHAILSGTPPGLSTLRPDTPAELAEVVGRALVKDRGRRAITAADARDLASACVARLTSGVQTVSVRNRASRRTVLGVVALLLVVAVAAAWLIQRNARVRWAREQALPEIIRLAGTDRFYEAFQLAQTARRHIPNDPLLAEQFSIVSRRGSVVSDPPGGEVYYRPYNRGDVQWSQLGQTPLKDVVVPRGLLHWKVEMPGRPTAEDIGPGPFWPPRFQFALPAQSPDGMVRVVASTAPFNIFIPGLDHLPRVAMPDFWIDRHEVTNRQFKRFVDEGGYQRREWWSEPFTSDGHTLTWQQAMTHFRDTTGRPGPATWEMGSYLQGQDDYPVAGVSWYEAAAYAKWAGKSLPTIFHWSRVADQRTSGSVVPASNFGGKGLVPVGSSGGVNRAGATDLAGNVKEWCWNSAGAKRYVLGGAWNEPVYMFTDADAQSPFARLPTYGFRCIKLDRPEDLAANLAAPVEFPSRDLRQIKPVSEPVFQAYRSLYSFDHGALDAKVESVDDSSSEWRRERVSYAAAYGGERVIAHLFIPKNAKPPFQTVLIFPGSSTISQRSSDKEIAVDRIDWIIRSGRAVLHPVYKSTFERHDVIETDYPSRTAMWRDHMIMWSKDVGRSIDYLESRREIDRTRIAYYGFSWGAGMGPLFLAVEPRLTLAVLIVGGFYLQPALPEADPVNFASWVKVPVLMLNGRYDFFFPTEGSQEPMYNLLGTPAEHKRRLVYDTSHTIPRAELIRQCVDWMDRYLGPAKRE